MIIIQESNFSTNILHLYIIHVVSQTAAVKQTSLDGEHNIGILLHAQVGVIGLMIFHLGKC